MCLLKGHTYLNKMCFLLMLNDANTGVFCKKDVLKNLANFTGKHLCWSLFLINVVRNGVLSSPQQKTFLPPPQKNGNLPSPKYFYPLPVLKLFTPPSTGNKQNVKLMHKLLIQHNC